MGSEWIIGALAFLTIGGVLALAIVHFGSNLRHPGNREAAKRVAANQASAATELAAAEPDGRSLRQRLDEAPGINDRLGQRDEGLGPLDVLTDTKWSLIQATLKGRPTA